MERRFAPTPTAVEEMPERGARHLLFAPFLLLPDLCNTNVLQANGACIQVLQIYTSNPYFPVLNTLPLSQLKSTEIALEYAHR